MYRFLAIAFIWKCVLHWVCFRIALREGCLTFHQLKIFDAVAKHLSITKAARDTRISQPSISKQLRLLEEEYGVKFHTRVGQGIRLTGQGQEFWKTIQPILHQIESLKSTFPLTEKERWFSIGATYSPSVYFVPDVLRIFRQTYGDVQPVIRTGDSRLVEQMVLSFDAEVGIITYPSYHPRLIVESFRAGEIAAVVDARHPLAKKRRLMTDEFATAPFIVKIGGRIETLLKQKKLNLHVIMKCESGEAVKAAVESGLGIGLIYREYVEHGLRRGYLKTLEIPCLKEIEFKWFIIYRKGEQLSRHAEYFIRVLNQLPRWPN